MLDFGAQRDLATVLLIDDDMISREVLATLLTLSGYTIHTAADGADALEMLTAGRFEPDVVLIDAQMPWKSFSMRTRPRRLRHPRRSWTPICPSSKQKPWPSSAP